MVTLFDKAATIKSRYKLSYDESAKRRDDAKEYMFNNVKPNSPKWREESERIPAEFSESVQAAKSEAKAALKKAIDEAHADNMGRMSFFASPKLKEVSELLGRLESISNITPAEMETLAKRYSGSYWSDKLLTEFAQKRGIRLEGMEPDYATREAAVSELEKTVNDYLDNYDGSIDISTIDSQFSNTLDRIEATYTNNFANMTIADAKAAEMAVKSIYAAPDVLAKGFALSNALKTAANESTRQMILDKVILDDKLDSVSIKMANAEQIIADHKQAMTETNLLPDDDTMHGQAVRRAYSELTVEAQAMAQEIAKATNKRISLELVDDIAGQDVDTLNIRRKALQKANLAEKPEDKTQAIIDAEYQIAELRNAEGDAPAEG